MSVMEITEYPEKVLGEVGEPVTEFDEEFEKLVDDMFETMYREEGVGLAAPQVGLSLRLFVMDCAGLKVVAANPEIISKEGEQDGEEGCLSVGRVHAALKRAAKVTLRAQDAKGNWYEQEAEGLAARCFQHETDHCDGIVFLDKTSPLKRELVKRKIRKLQKQGKW